ncbi:iron complex transport system ATP-binding protein [Clostridium tetanomorphum]|uniref:ABC transporter ATP-binding protein n=1 Tax=Clostridium tetanomorphum TaxID=1553 RepID=A0A923IZQ6_CLOTT|nr:MULTISPECIES: ABC transporter ATP-binding protein [Clostridium]KAJ53535.1 ferrichrome transport ATP-binding protein FhuC [Clostridium tetanomorphum DSM 665]MBC2396909.1 ABC transporter ATP-binding protein [Clostridium tetanomorphum]MBC2425477.1 ABC transporter ATP-binding protein [Clostridium beijerinckii]MBP1863127.1 iron complex transport system ATP-binding protein [Clostridium tetanomorphum]NRS84235.1 iron complex transport system ATP-binding protein [Clostridium tetanomorphum]
MNSIATKKLAIAYDDKLIVDDLNINIPKGKITTIIGPNGCGKSTVLKTVGRILKPKKGVVYLNGDDIRNLSTKEVAQKMAILPQSPQAQARLTVGEIVSYGGFPHQRGFGKLSSEDKKIITWALEITKLTEFETRTVDNLSGGQRQRVWIAMALAQQTDLILLDEPTTYLDMAYQLEVLELLYKLNREQNCTIVMVLHDLNLAARFADYMIAIRSGKIIRHGTPKEIMTKKVLKDTFHIDAEIGWESRTGRPTCISYELIK